MDFSLREAQRKLEREQKERREKARQKMERERKAREEAQARKEAEEEAKRLERLETAAKAAERQRQAEADLHAGGGIAYSAWLTAVPMPMAAGEEGEAGEAMDIDGVGRTHGADGGRAELQGTGDRILLPPSALSELPLDQALDRGPMFFQISVPRAAEVTGPTGVAAGTGMEVEGQGGEQAGKKGTDEGEDEAEGEEDAGMRSTHAGVEEFTAPEGCVILPPHVWRNLGLPSPSFAPARPGTEARQAPVAPKPGPQVRVRYVRLPKGTFAQLQAEEISFLDLPNHDSLLESNLRRHATLTMGDVVDVGYGSQRFSLKVLELKPERQVSLIETDLAVDVVPPPQSLARKHGETVQRSQGKVASGKAEEVKVGPKGVRLGGGEGGLGRTRLLGGSSGGMRDREVGAVLPPSSPSPPPPPAASTAPVSAAAAASSAFQQASKPLGVGKEVEEEIAAEDWRFFRVQLDGSVARQVDAGEAELVVLLTVALRDEREWRGDTPLDVDLYASVPPVVRPSMVDHVWASNHKIGSKTLVISSSPSPPSSSSLGGECLDGGSNSFTVPFKSAAAAARAAGSSITAGLCIGAYASQGSGSFRLSLTVCPIPQSTTAEVAREKEGQSTGRPQLDGSGSGGEATVPPPSGDGGEEDVGTCSNCRKPLPRRTLPLHEAFCARNNAVCSHPGCGAVLLRSELAGGAHQHCGQCGVLSGSEAEARKHAKLWHSRLQCSCGARLPLREMTLHRRKICPDRLITCRFCGAPAKAGGQPTLARDAARGLTAHEAACGSRTAPCDTCRRPVTLKDMDVHVAAFHSSRSLVPPLPYGGVSGVERDWDIVSGGHEATVRVGEGGKEKEIGQSGTYQGLLIQDPAWQVTGAASATTVPSSATATTVSAPAAAAAVGDNPAHTPPWAVEPPSVPPHASRTGPAPGAGIAGPQDGSAMDETAAASLGPAGNASVEAATFRRALNVSCPICGLMVHSERDLDRHFDAVH